MFTPDYWRQEVAFFKNAIVDPDVSDEAAARLLQGIAHLAAQVERRSQALLKGEVLDDCQTCLELAQNARGMGWLWAHIEIIAAHFLNGTMPM